MTHDELLANIEWLKGVYVNRKNCQACIKYLDTISAVVELHKPFQVATGGSWTPEGSTQTFETTCNHCGQLNSAVMVLYPCPTIRAIEKELR